MTSLPPSLTPQFAPDRAAPGVSTSRSLHVLPGNDDSSPILSPRGRRANLEVLQAPLVRMVYAAEHRRLFGCLPAWCTP